MKKKPRRKKKQDPKEQVMWLIVGAGAAMLASTLVEKSLKAGWRAATDEDPPLKPEALTTSWKEAVAWTALSAVVLG